MNSKLIRYLYKEIQKIYNIYFFLKGRKMNSKISTRLQNQFILIFSLIVSLLFAVYIKGELKKKEIESYKPKTIVLTPGETITN